MCRKQSTTIRKRGYRIHILYEIGGPVEVLPLIWDSDIPQVWLNVRDRADVVYGKLVACGRKIAEFRREGVAV